MPEMLCYYGGILLRNIRDQTISNKHLSVIEATKTWHFHFKILHSSIIGEIYPDSILLIDLKISLPPGRILSIWYITSEIFVIFFIFNKGSDTKTKIESLLFPLICAVLANFFFILYYWIFLDLTLSSVLCFLPRRLSLLSPLPLVCTFAIIFLL